MCKTRCFLKIYKTYLSLALKMSNKIATNRHSIVRLLLFMHPLHSCTAENALGRAKKYIEVSGRPGPAQFHSPLYSRSRDVYNLTWSIESIPKLDEIRILYRKLMVIWKHIHTHALIIIDTFCKLKSFSIVERGFKIILWCNSDDGLLLRNIYCETGTWNLFIWKYKIESWGGKQENEGWNAKEVLQVASIGLNHFSFFQCYSIH